MRGAACVELFITGLSIALIIIILVKHKYIMFNLFDCETYIFKLCKFTFSCFTRIKCVPDETEVR